MSVLCEFILCVGRSLATSWCHVREDLLTVCRIKKLKKQPRPNKGLYSHNNNNNKKTEPFLVSRLYAGCLKRRQT
jgi:hypothetical protein